MTSPARHVRLLPSGVRNRFHILLALIFLAALALRLIGAWCGALMYDEATHLACAETIDLRPGSFNLVWRSVDHPWLSVYVLRLSSWAFGTGNFGIRVLHATVGAATVIPVFLLAQRTVSTTAGLWAAALLAVDQFHMTWSYFACPEVLLLFFSTLVLVLFLRAVRTERLRDFVLLGGCIGMAYTAKETAVLLIPALWLCVVSSKRRRRLLRTAGWYAMHAAALLVVLPEVIVNIARFYEGYLYRDMALLSHARWPSYSAGLLYLGEAVEAFTAPRGGYRTLYATQNPALCHWPAGVLYLTGVVYSLRHWRDWPLRTLGIVFGFLVAFFTFLPSEARTLYWWASISLIPAVVFGGRLIHRLPVALPAFFFTYLLFHATNTALRPGIGVPRRTAAQIQDAAVARAREARTPDALARLERSLLHALHIGGPNAEIYGLLARTANIGENAQRAAYFRRRQAHAACRMQLRSKF